MQTTEKVSKSKKRNRRKALKAAALAAELAAKDAKLVAAAAAAAAANKRESARDGIIKKQCITIANSSAIEYAITNYKVVIPDLSGIISDKIAGKILELCTHANKFQCNPVIRMEPVPNLVRMSNNPVNVSSRQHGVYGRPDQYDGVQFKIHIVRQVGFLPAGATGEINTSIGDDVVSTISPFWRIFQYCQFLRTAQIVDE